MHFENLEDLAQETGSEQHSRALNADACDAGLGGNGLYGSSVHPVVDDGAGRRGVHSVQQTHRYAGECRTSGETEDEDSVLSTTRGSLLCIPSISVQI